VTKFPHNFDNAPVEQPAGEAEGEPEPDDLLPEDDGEDEWGDEEEDEDDEGMMDDEVDLAAADEGVENRDPSRQPAGSTGAALLQGKAAGLAAAVADAGAGVEDMEL
jgi:hypothetical protein